MSRIYVMAQNKEIHSTKRDIYDSLHCIEFTPELNWSQYVSTEWWLVDVNYILTWLYFVLLSWRRDIRKKQRGNAEYFYFRCILIYVLKLHSNSLIASQNTMCGLKILSFGKRILSVASCWPGKSLVFFFHTQTLGHFELNRRIKRERNKNKITTTTCENICLQ